MKKSYRVENLCCANCAAKIERRISKLPEVASVSLNFMTLRLTIESETENWDALLDSVQAIFRKVEPDSRVVL